MRVPVIVFCVGLKEGEVAWSAGNGAHVDSGGVRIRKVQELPQTLSSLESHLTNWMDTESSARQILAVPRISARLARRREQMSYDWFMSLEDEHCHDLAALYEEVVLLRQALGLSFSKILPWSLWMARARRVFRSSGGDLYWGIHDEILSYIGPLADEAIREGKDRLRREEPTPENVYAKAFAEDYTMRWTMPTAFDDAGDAFWCAMEAELERSGALILKSMSKGSRPNGGSQKRLS